MILAKDFYINDVKLNWAINEDKPCYIHDYFSWGENDLIEVVSKMFVMKVSVDFFNYAVFGLHELPIPFWRRVKGKSECSKKFPDVLYTCLLTDGERVMAVSTYEGDLHATKKSRVSMWDEMAVLKMSEAMEVEEFDTSRCRRDAVTIDRVFDNESLLGVTREEISDRDLILEHAYNFYDIGDEKALRYYLKEFDHVRFKDTKGMCVNGLFEQLVSCVTDGWGEGHDRLLDVMKVLENV